jgi:myo-inositol 2-dehydrogenase / D-chiro-inositol 1-dehydrogenase
MKTKTLAAPTRRDFLKTTALAAASLAVPTIVPASVFGKNAPSNRITIGAIGTGRIAREHDLPEVRKYAHAQVVAVCDVDARRLQDAKKFMEDFYAQKRPGGKFKGVQTYADYRELLANKKIDAVVVSTPDHWHAQIAMEAALAGKDIYLQKPTSLTIAEGRALSDVIRQTGRILQIGSQQRSAYPWPHFKRACELVRNGRIGQLRTVHIGLPGDPGGDPEPEMPVPKTLNYDLWLGSTPQVYYTEKRVHPQADYSRPGWLRCEQFGAGMITGWGAHHVDTAHWGMGTELTGPVEVEATAQFPKSGLWNVHGPFNATAKYANGVAMILGGDNPNGVKFVGSEGWIFVTRGSGVTASDPTGAANQALVASDPKILGSVIGEAETKLYLSPDQHGNWLDCIRTRQQPVAPAEVGHRSTSACLLVHHAMKLGRKLYWDPAKEQFVNDDAANALIAKPQRQPYGTSYVKRKG